MQYNVIVKKYFKGNTLKGDKVLKEIKC